MSEERVNKYLAKCGFGSRRFCDTIIDEGRVLVDGKAVEKGQKIDGDKVVVTVDGEAVSPAGEKEYYLYHKKTGSIVSKNDPHNPYTIYDALTEAGLDAAHLRYVGRLDKESEGALLLTNDGDMIHAITHPRFHIKKTYWVEVTHKVNPKNIEKMVEEGVESDDQILHAGAVRDKGEVDGRFCYEVDLYEGKNRQVRRLFAGIGHEVLRLKRTQFANITLRDLPYGEFRALEEREIRGLKGKGFSVNKKHPNKKQSPSDESGFGAYQSNSTKTNSRKRGHDAKH